MTNQQGTPEALRLADSYAKAHAMYCMEDLYGTSKAYTAELLKERHAARERLAAALVEAQQPAPSAAVAGAIPANPHWDYLRRYWQMGFDGVSLGACTGDAPIKAWHEGKAARAAAPQPSPTPQADSQPAPTVGTIAHVGTGKTTLTGAITSALRAASTEADSVTAPAGGADWQDISTAPKDGTRFVAVGQNYGLDSEAQHTCIAQWFRGCWMEVSDWNEASELKYLTHWMPLPPPPTSADGVDHG